MYCFYYALTLKKPGVMLLQSEAVRYKNNGILYPNATKVDK
ncbi:hypothetical protein MAQ5080_01815 [Marinomonas aquimarina]|uniref:Uncharacterized protein n=1 Tax=Marinomonas aquimarina TaxID=295068 RepID=A0A1A8TFM2_9GAMM|nr:hypothetical protein MAQ5080_01815 [Marinomonas aquimarina]